MSKKLLNQSLDILDVDMPSQHKSKDEKEINCKINKARANILGTEKKKFFRSAADRIKDKKNNTDERFQRNLKSLMALSKNTIKLKDAEFMIQRAHYGRPVNAVRPKVVTESIFTEEDFRKFEEEYKYMK